MPFFGVPIRNGLPIGLGSVAGFGVQQFDPSQLFEGGTVAGAWYDPSDLSTMFDTSAGTTPVAMPGQGSAVSVGLMLDKSQNGVGTNGAKRVNLLTYSEEFSNAAWKKENSTAANTTATLDPLGGTTADVYTNTAAGDWLNTASAITIVAGLNYTFSVYAKRGTQDWLRLSGWNDATGTGTTQAFNAWFNLATGVKGTLSSGADGTAVSHDMVSVGNGWYRCTVTGRSTALTTLFPELNMTTADAVTTRPATGNEVYIWGADLRLASEANTAPTYQPITSSWYATLPGNHAIAANDSTKRPELRARVNLLTYSEEFDNGVWTKNNLNTTGTPAWVNVAVAPDGTTTADKLIANLTNGVHRVFHIVTASQTYTYSVYAKAGEYGYLFFGSGNPGVRTYFDLLTGVVVGASSGAGLTNPTITPVGNGWYRCSGVVASGGTEFVIGAHNTGSGSESFTGDDTSGIYIWGADLRPANIGANVPAYQRIADANTYDTNGFPLYLRFDGIDDSMYTPANLNLSGTDKVSVFAGVRKLSDAAASPVAETSSSSINAGAFGLFDPAGGTSPDRTYSFRSESAIAISSPEVLAPTTYVSASQANRAAPSIVIRRNGVQVGSTTASQGAGNYSTYPLYIGSRNNAGNWFNGHLHSLIIAGSAVSAGNISATEQWVAGKTGISIFNDGPSITLNFDGQTYQVWEI